VKTLIAIMAAIFGGMRLLGPVLTRVGLFLGVTFGIVNKVLASKMLFNLWLIEPLVEGIFEMMTGIRGPVSQLVQWMVTQGFNLALGFTFHVSVQQLISNITPSVQSYARYLGLTSAISSLLNGIEGALTILLEYQISLIVFRIKAKIWLSRYTRLEGNTGGNNWQA